MSNTLQATFAQQLHTLLQQIRQGWAWPSPGIGFALHVFQAANASYPCEVGSLLLSEADKHRLDQAPVLAAVGYAFTLPIAPHDIMLLQSWADGLERVSARTAFPRDRQSFAYRPVELLGIVLGVLHCNQVKESTKEWLRDVLIEAENKLASGSSWEKLLSACAAHLYNVSWRMDAPSSLIELTAQELALICWFGAAYPAFTKTINLSPQSAATKLGERSALNLFTTLDASEAAVLHFALQQTVQHLLADSNFFTGVVSSTMQLASSQAAKPLRAFISYSHDRDVWEKLEKDPDTHRKRVLELVQRLRGEGIDCIIDQLIPNPPEGWPRWMTNQVDQADFVLVVATETYNRRFRGLEDKHKGHGAQWEGANITQELYDANGQNTKFIPIIFDHADASHIPLPLRSATYYNVSSPMGYDELYFYLTNQPENVPAPLGSIRKRNDTT